jgi:hypothetical protein
MRRIAARPPLLKRPFTKNQLLPLLDLRLSEASPQTDQTCSSKSVSVSVSKSDQVARRSKSIPIPDPDFDPDFDFDGARSAALQKLDARKDVGPSRI